MPDFEKTKPPAYRPPSRVRAGRPGLAGDDAFIMQSDGKGWLYVPDRADRRPVADALRAGRVAGPQPALRAAGQPDPKVYDRPDNPIEPEPAASRTRDVFPYVFTTSRLTEHHTAGGMSRTLAYLSELQPAMFVEVSPELAAERGLTHLGWAHVSPPASAIEAQVLVTDRLPAAAHRRAQVVHQVWLPYHWGGTGLTTGDSANDLFGIDPRPERADPGEQGRHLRRPAGRRPTGPALLDVRRGLPPAGRAAGRDQGDPPTAGAASRRRGGLTIVSANSLYGPLDPAPDAGYADAPPRMGFFTDTSVCIGCKACEVACKEWNGVPRTVSTCSACPTTTPAAWTRTPGGTSRSSSSPRRRRNRGREPR